MTKKKSMGENPLDKSTKEMLNWVSGSKKQETRMPVKKAEANNSPLTESENRKIEGWIRHEFKASVMLTERLMKYKIHHHKKKPDILTQALEQFLTHNGY